jgi:F420H(2)-dependent quinone reductase
MMASKPPRQLNSQFTVTITRYLSRAHTVVYRLTRGRFGGNLRVGAGFRKPAPTLLLEHRGRRSGKRFTSPVLYITDGPDVIIVASAAGRDEHPQWYRNLLAHPDIDIGADRRAVTAVQADTDERARLWPQLTAAYADFDSYQSWTTRELPVMVLQPR